MKIIVDAQNEIMAVATDAQALPEGFVSVPDNDDLISNPAKYRWNGASVEPKPCFVIATDAEDTTGNGIPDVASGGTHNLTITAKDKDGNVDTAFEDTVTLRIFDAMSLFDSKQVTFVNGVGEVAVSYVRVFTPAMNLSAAGRFSEDFRVEFR